MAEGKTILVVDDDPLVLRGIGRIFTRAGFQVLTAADGIAAMVIIDDDESKSIDAVLSDIDMPGMKGLELVERVHAQRPDIALCLMSGRERPESEFTFLSKPLSAKTLVSVLTRLIAEADTNPTVPRKRRPGSQPTL